MLLSIALLHGLLYLALIPPWQHYDEPTHFEYVRLIALWGRVPAVDESDLATSREIADSMYRFRFWSPHELPDMISPAAPNIGINEKVHPPLYYAIAAVPVRWLLAASIEQQLYAARMVGVGLYVLTVASAWRIASILAPERLGTSLAPPLIVALAPSFADQMSSLNGDVLVNFASTALLLGCVLLVRHSLRVVPLLLVALGLLVAVAAKRTALIDVVPVALAIYWSIVRRPVRWFIWLGVLVAVLFVAGSTMLQLSPAGVSLRPWLADLDQRYLRLSLGRLLTAPAVPADLRGYRVLFQVVFSSFWFGFGWGQVTVAPFWEWAVLGVTLASAVGLALIASQRWRAPDLWRRRVAWLFVAMLASASLAVVVRFGLEQSSYVPRGRYLHLAMLPAIWLLVLGFQHLAPERRRRQAIGGLVIFFIVLDVVCWAGVLSSFYYR